MKVNNTLLCLMLSASSIMNAETVGVLGNDSSKVIDLDEVTIVAVPKEPVRLRQQPLSSNVFGESQIERLHVSDLRELSAYVPSMAMPQYGSRLTSSIYLRGTGSRINASAPSVPVYYDNIPLLSKSAFNSHFSQIERVDILRGPQATLYGMNSEGGLVRIFSKDPMRKQGTEVNLSLGSYFQRSAEVAHRCKLNDKLAIGLSAFYSGTDGYIDNTNLGDKNDKSNEAGGKMRLVWNITTKFKADFTADYQFTNQNAFPYGHYNVNEGRVEDPSTSMMNKYRRNMLNSGIHLFYDFGLWTLQSTTSFQHLYDNMTMDQDYTPVNTLMLEQHQKENAWSEEITMSSKNKSSWQWATGFLVSHQYMKTDAPVYFLSDFNNQMQKQLNMSIPAMMQQAMVDGMVAKGMPEAAAQATAQKTIDAMKFNMHDFQMSDVPGSFRTPSLNLAVFHESNIALNNRLTATIGLRYDYLRQQLDYETQASMKAQVSMMAKGQPTTIPYIISSVMSDSRSTNEGHLLPKVGLTWRFNNDGSNLYAVVSKGYRAGGYNIQMFSDILQSQLRMAARDYHGGKELQIENNEAVKANIEKTISYKAEKSWNYEVGTHLNLFGGLMHADLSAYLMRVNDLQLSKMASQYSFGRMMMNAGKSENMGIEVSLRGHLIDNQLNWAATYSFTKATFREYTDSVKGQQVDYSGNCVPFVPKHMFSVMGDYCWPMNHNNMLRSVTVGVNVAGEGQTYWDEANTANQKLYATLGAHIGFDLGTFNIDFWGRNLTDTNYVVFGLPYSNGFIGQRGIPRIVGVDVKVKM